jgi:hypothetical protein
MTFSINNTQHNYSMFMYFYCHAVYRCAERGYAECRNAESGGILTRKEKQGSPPAL